MKSQNINHAFLDTVLDGSTIDNYYHLGITSQEPMLDRMRTLKAIIMAGSGERMKEFAQLWSEFNGHAEIHSFPKEDRFLTRYTQDVLFVSHGMGMPSASIAVQELMRLAYYLKGGDVAALDDVFWARVGTSGGVGLPGGSVVVSSEGLMADLRPYRLLAGGNGEYWFDSAFPEAVRQEIIEASKGSGIPIHTGATVAGNEFFLEQFRLDGAICLETSQTKLEWLTWLDEHGVRNIEMEGAMFAGYLNHWGFSRFAMICCTLLNRLEGDQVTATPEQLHQYGENAATVLFNYLRLICAR